MPTALKLLTNGGDRTGVAINSTGIFLDFETTFSTKASYLTVKNLGVTFALLINFNTAAIDVTAAIDKTIVVDPGGSVSFQDEEISNATIFCSGVETTLANYIMGKRNYMRGGA